MSGEKRKKEMSYTSIQDRINSLRRTQPSAQGSPLTQRYNRGSLRSRSSQFQVHIWFELTSCRLLCQNSVLLSFLYLGAD